MSALISRYNLLNEEDRTALQAAEPQRFTYRPHGAAYLDLRGLALEPILEIEEDRVATLCRVVRGMSFAAVDAAKSGHPGGSTSKAEMVISLLVSGVLGFNAWRPKHPGRDRVVWSAGHTTPLFHSVVSLIYETLRRKGFVLPPEQAGAAVYPEQLIKFRRWGGPSGHVESQFALADTSTGSSGHGFSAGLGFAVLHRGCGLATRAFVIAGDAETEEGMSYEARNVAAALQVRNLIVTLDYNTFGIDGSIFEAIPAPYLEHWYAHGWNVIEVDGHNPRELVYAYRLAVAGFGAERPTVLLCHTRKGLGYGKLEGTGDSHGTPLSHDEYVAAVRKLGFDILGRESDPGGDIAVILAALSRSDIDYFATRLQAAAARVPAEEKLVQNIQSALQGRPVKDYRSIERPEKLPPELVFREGDLVPTRKASEAWFEWVMRQTAFFYIGAGDLMKSILTGKAEQVYGIVKPDNPLGRGIRFGIAEQNMSGMCCAMAQDTLPGGFRPMSAFASYGVFGPLMSNPIRMTLINTSVNPSARAFFILLAAHDGPETGEDGPTHHGLFWMSLFSAYPGIKVYKPLDANETVEMLFHALKLGEPIALSVVRPGTPVLRRDNAPPARAAIDGAYVFKRYSGNGRRKLVLVVCGGQVMANTLEVVPQLEEEADVKIVAVTSPQLFERLPVEKRRAVLADDERPHVVALHNGWRGFLYPFLMPGDWPTRVFGMDDFSRSGKPPEIYQNAGFDPAGILARVRRSVTEPRP